MPETLKDSLSQRKDRDLTSVKQYLEPYIIPRYDEATLKTIIEKKVQENINKLKDHISDTIIAEPGKVFDADQIAEVKKKLAKKVQEQEQLHYLTRNINVEIKDNVLIRDARFVNKDETYPSDVHLYNMQYLNSVMAALDLVTHSKIQDKAIAYQRIIDLANERIKKFTLEEINQQTSPEKRQELIQAAQQEVSEAEKSNLEEIDKLICVLEAHEGGSEEKKKREDNINKLKQDLKSATGPEEKKKIKQDIDDLQLEAQEWYIRQKLTTALQYQNFEHQQYSIATITGSKCEVESEIDKTQQIKTNTIEIDTPITEISDANKKMYDYLEQQAFYLALNNTEKKLVTQYKDKILDGKHQINTQLRNIPGLRNAYNKLVMFQSYSDQDDQSLSGPIKMHEDVIDNILHSGTIASNNKNQDAAQRITENNLSQLQEHTGSKLQVLSLNSNNYIQDEELAIVQRARKAVSSEKSQNAGFINISYNYFKTVSVDTNKDAVKMVNKAVLLMLDDAIKKNDNTALKHQLQELTTEPKPGFIDLLLRKTKEEIKRERILKFFAKNKEKLADYQLTVKYANEIMNAGWLKTSSRQANLSTAVALLANQANNYINDENEKIFVATSCKSGKDRTGLFSSMMTQMLAEEMFHKKFPDLNEKNVQKLAKNLVKDTINSGHIQALAGSAYAGGCTIGCMGIKGEAKSGVPLGQSYFKDLVKQTSKYNKYKEKHASHQENLKAETKKLKAEKDSNTNSRLSESGKVSVKPSLPSKDLERAQQMGQTIKNNTHTQDRSSSSQKHNQSVRKFNPYKNPIRNSQHNSR